MFDCFDGQFARRHKMKSAYGDYYDHFKEWTIMILIFYVLYRRNKMFLAIIFASYTLCSIHMGCQEYYHDKSNPLHSGALKFCKKLCPRIIKKKQNNLVEDDLEDLMKYTKWLGGGTVNVIMSILLFYLK